MGLLLGVKGAVQCCVVEYKFIEAVLGMKKGRIAYGLAVAIRRAISK